MIGINNFLRRIQISVHTFLLKGHTFIHNIIRRTRRRKLISIAVVLILLFTFVPVFDYAVNRTATASSSKHKTVISIQIEEGDTLWGIASRYYSDECVTMKNYIAEIKKTNGIQTDAIHTYAYLLVPYYE